MEHVNLGKKVFQREFALWAVGLHLGALFLVPLYFSWGNLALAFILAAITAYSLGIFHHMYLSHRSFKAHPIFANIGVLLGTLTWRGPMAAPLRYVALHKIHHRYSDQDFDPHSPVHGMFHSIIGWNWRFSSFFTAPEKYQTLTGRHMQNRWFVFLDQNVHMMQLALAALLFISGGLFGGWLKNQVLFDLHSAIGWVAYGIFAKTLLVIYMANLVDVLNHGFGYRNYQTSDRSTNSFLLAFIHLGGAISWHNNHHAHPRFFSVKRNGWEFDMHRKVIEFFSIFGWVHDIKVLDESGPTQKTLIDFLSQNALLASLMIVNRLLQVTLSLTVLMLLPSWPLSIYLKIVISAALTFIAAVGFHNLALLGHEGTHFNLARGRMRSSVVGTLLSALVPFHFNTGFAISHAAHHVWTNTNKDPDVSLFRQFRGWSQRLFIARRYASLRYFFLTWKAAFRNDLGLTIPGLKANEVKWLARLNLFASAIFLTVEIFLMVSLGAAYATGFALSYIGAYLLSAVRPYLEHAGTDDKRLTAARTFSSGLLDFTFGTINFHLAHHLYPRVPAYHLPELHRWLVENKVIANDGVETIADHRLKALGRVITSNEYGVR